MMANIKSQKKRILTNEKSRLANKQIKSQIKTIIKKYKVALHAKTEDVQELKNQAISLIDKSLTKGVYHKNKTNHLKSMVMQLDNK